MAKAQTPNTPPLKIAILSRNAKLYSTKRLVEAAEARGHSAQVIDTLRCYMNIATDEPTIHYRGKPLSQFDAIIPRIGASISHYGLAVVRQFEMMGVFAVNGSVAVNRSRDKLRALQLLSRRGVGLPITGFASSPDDIPDLIDMVGGPPLVIKLVEGTQGLGVLLAENRKSATAMIEAFISVDANILVQEFIKEAKGADIRCFVVNGKVVAAMRRQAAPGDFRSNLHRGGKASKIKLTPEEEQTAIKAAQIMGLDVAGVDLLRAERGPVVLEVNSSPGLQGIEKASNKDVAGEIIQFIEKNVTPHEGA